MSEHRQFAAPWSTSLKVISIVTSIFTVALAVVGFVLAQRPGPPVWLFLWVPLLLGIVCALFTVRGYEVRGRELFVTRLWWSTRVDLAGLREVRAEPDAMRRSLRLCGNGGWFSFTGWFRNRPLGVYRAFVTDLKRTVVLLLPKRALVVSPDDPERFVAVASELIGK